MQSKNVHFKRSILSSLICSSALLAFSQGAIAQEVDGDRAKLKLNANDAQVVKGTNKGAGFYIVQLKGKPGVEKAKEYGELLPKNQSVSKKSNRYNAQAAKVRAYNNRLVSKQQELAQSAGKIDITYSYKHTFNGFSARLTQAQVKALESSADVVGVWEDKVQQPMTANTPKFLGLTEPGGQHDMGTFGEDVVIGIVDTGIWPEHPSFSGEGYNPLAGWNGTCDVAEDEAFTCNNKLIGARFYKESFEANYEIQVELGEFISPRDADGHGSHTASTAGGNSGVAANANGFDAGFVSGIAPRARIAAYKVCWNSSYVSPEGNEERGCFASDSMAAIDQAVVDGVDVINFSIGGSRTDLTYPSTAAMLSAAEAGVFVAVSAGNSGPTASTVGTPAPWVASVAASTYDGTVPARAIEATINEDMSTITAVEGAINKSIVETGTIEEALVVAQPLEGCFVGGEATALDNADDIDGKIALISRGSCSFSEKLNRALLSGAKGVVVFNNRAGAPIVMGGTGDFDLAAFMIDQADGESLKGALDGGSAVTVKLDESLTGDLNVIGNIMADFSSRGPNLSTADIMKPDITAPGVQILAATTPQPMFGSQGNMFAYLQGTSMSSPHIAGMAALFKESHPSWSPAQIKSALMTSARQNVTLSDGSDATPFNFGSGHAQPVDAMTPGLLFDLGINDYLGLLCGLGESDFVAEREVSCDDLNGAGFSDQASELNLPSITVSNLMRSTTVTRVATNAENVASSYTATIEAPAGVDVAIKTFDADGNETPSDTLDVEANGTASFAVTMSQNTSAAFGAYAFGSITWADSAGHSVRLPLVIRPEVIVDIEVPAIVSKVAKRGRVSFPVKMLYSGRTSIDYVGMHAPSGITGNVEQDEDASFSFNEDGLGTHFFHIPEGTKVARFSLRDALVTAEGSDLDLFVYRCEEWSCSRVGQSLNAASNEDVILTDPTPAADISVGTVYLIWVHGFDIGDDQANTDYVMPTWIVDTPERTTRVRSSRRAIEGRFNNVTVSTRGLEAGVVHMGAVSFYDAAGNMQGTTVLEIVPE
jgi:hypothetical protein